MKAICLVLTLRILPSLLEAPANKAAQAAYRRDKDAHKEENSLHLQLNLPFVLHLLLLVLCDILLDLLSKSFLS